MSAAQEGASPPPPPSLPLDVRDLYLSHLLPPCPPLPPHALSRTFIDRLTFLPPDESDLDAHLTPFTMAKNALNPNALHVALDQLSSSFKVADTEYSHDGEMTIARAKLQPEYGYSTAGDVEAYFEHEDGDHGRGWVYRGASLSDANVGSAWDWKSNVDDVRPSYGGHGYSNDSAPEDYWAGFTPPGQRAELPTDDNDEDDYWAQYGAGAPEPERQDESSQIDADERAPSEPEPVTPPAATIPTPDPAATLSILLQGLGVSRPSSPPPAAAPRAAESVLEQKVRAKVRAQLMRAWAAFSADQDAESCAYEWLRITRATADRPSWQQNHQQNQSTYGDVRAAVVTARIEAAKDMFDVLDSDDFFRLCEEAIRVHSPPMQQGEEAAPFEYES